MTPPRCPKLIFALTECAIEVWARPRGLRPSDVVHVLTDPHRHLRGRNFTTADLVHLNRASEHPNFKEAVSFLGNIPLAEPSTCRLPGDPMSSRPAKKQLLRELRAQHDVRPSLTHDAWTCTRGWALTEMEAAEAGRHGFFWLKQAHFDGALSKLRRVKSKRHAALRRTGAWPDACDGCAKARAEVHPNFQFIHTPCGHLMACESHLAACIGETPGFISLDRTLAEYGRAKLAAMTANTERRP